MPLHVICPGCLKRFQVSARFAGMKGPCPNCETIISIPTESVKIHEFDTPEKGKGNKPNNLLRPIPRLDLDIDPAHASRLALAVLGTFSLALLLGYIPMPPPLRSCIGIIGLCLIAFPLTLFGYRIMLDREQIFAFTGEELYRRTGIVAIGYIIFWLGFEYFLTATQADLFVSGLYFTVFATLAALLAQPLLELKTRDIFFHYCIFGGSVTLFRFLIGLGWFWESSEFIRYSAAPPPPLLPGM